MSVTNQAGFLHTRIAHVLPVKKNTLLLIAMNQICTLPLTYHHTLNFCHWQPDTLIFDHIIFSCNDLVVTSSITMSKVRGEVVTCINIHHRFQVCTAEFTSFCDWQDCFKIVLRLSNFLAILQMLQWAMCNKTLHGYPINFVLGICNYSCSTRSSKDIVVQITELQLNNQT